MGVIGGSIEERGDIRRLTIGHFTVVYLVAKPLIWSEAKSDLVVMETSMITK